MLRASVDLGAIAEVIADRKRTATGMEPVETVPLLKTGPKPCAVPTAHPTKHRRYTF